MKEWTNASFNKKRRQNIQKTEQERRHCYNRNNARNRDLFTKGKACGKAFYLEDILNKDGVAEATDENKLIEILDSLDVANNLEDRNDD